MGFASSGRGLIGLVLVALALGQPRLIVLVVAVGAVSGIVDWFRRTWSFDGTTITLDEGVISRTYRRVPVSRIQHVEVNEPFLHRLVGFAVVRVETAGAAGQSEVIVDALERREAGQLQQAIVAARARALAGSVEPARVGSEEPSDPSAVGLPPPPPPPSTEEAVVLRLGTGRVMLAGVTGSNLLVVFAVMAALFDTIGRLPREVASSVEDQAGSVVASLGFLAGALALLALALVAAAMSAVATHHGLSVVRSGDELRLRRGLFERRDAVVPLARVQAVTIRQNPAQRVLGMSSLQIRSAGSASEGDDRLSIPLATPSEVDLLLDATVGRPVAVSGLVDAPIAARSRRVVRRAVAVMPILAVVAWFRPAFPDLAASVAVAVVVVAVWGVDAYRNLGHRYDGDVLVTRWGSLARRTVVVSVPRVQSIRIGSSPFQRQRDLASLRVDLAGRGVPPVVLDQSTVRCHDLKEQMRTRAPAWEPEPRYATLGAAHPTHDTPLEEQ